MKAQVLSGPGKKSLFKLYLKTQAGTYVKEFVHGDLGRTRPNISELLGFPADILALDVEVNRPVLIFMQFCRLCLKFCLKTFHFQGVDVDWPPEISDEK